MSSKLIIAGSRNLNSVYLIYAAMDIFNILKKDISTVISGCARGIDTVGAEWAADNCIIVKSMPAKWDKHGKSAGYIRNKEMAKEGDKLLAIWDGDSKGTLNMITEMQKLGKPVHIMEVYLK